MSLFLFRLYEHIQNRAVRLGILCTFVITFIGLPALGQYMETNLFGSLDLVDYMENRIDNAAISMEESRYQAYLEKNFYEDDQMVMLAEEEIDEELNLWDVENMFQNVFEPTH